MTASLLKVGFTGYRCFRTEQVLDLRPLTLLYGKNNAGKSAALRALAILCRSVADGAAAAWDVGGIDDPGRGASFRAFPWRSRATKSFTLRLVWKDNDDEFEDVIEIEQEGRFDPVRVRSVHPWDGPFWRRHPTDDGTHLYDRIEDGTPVAEEHLLFEPLLPAAGQHNALDGLRDRLLSLRGAVQWLHGGRMPAPRTVSLNGSRPKELRSDGSDAGHKLAMEQSTLLAGVNGFYARVNRQLRVDEGSRDDDARLLLDVIGLETMQIDLADVGEGMGKVLPVLVAVGSAASGTGPRMVAVEDPDVHLHEDTERHLAEHLCAVVRDSPTAIVVVETHSHTFLLAVQNQVRLGMPAKDVNVVWAQTEDDGSTLLTRVELSDGGLPLTSELRAAFREAGRLAAELAGLGD